MSQVPPAHKILSAIFGTIICAAEKDAVRCYTQLQPDVDETRRYHRWPVLGCCVGLSFLIDREHDERLAHGMRR